MKLLADLLCLIGLHDVYHKTSRSAGDSYVCVVEKESDCSRCRKPGFNRKTFYNYPKQEVIEK